MSAATNGTQPVAAGKTYDPTAAYNRENDGCSKRWDAMRAPAPGREVDSDYERGFDGAWEAVYNAREKAEHALFTVAMRLRKGAVDDNERRHLADVIDVCHAVLETGRVLHEAYEEGTIRTFRAHELVTPEAFEAEREASFKQGEEYGILLAKAALSEMREDARRAPKERAIREKSIAMFLAGEEPDAEVAAWRAERARRLKNGEPLSGEAPKSSTRCGTVPPKSRRLKVVRNGPASSKRAPKSSKPKSGGRRAA